MLIDKKILSEKIENLISKFATNIPVLGTDLADVVLFLSIYGGNNLVMAEEISVKQVGNKVEISKRDNSKKTEATFFSVLSYDKSIKLELILSKNYLKIEKIFDSVSNYYFVEYIFDEQGYFIRNAKQKSHPLEKQLEFFEKSKGNMNRGVCFSKITEKAQEIDTSFFKVQTSKGEEIYYSYKVSSDYVFNFRVPKQFQSIPSITSIGMKNLSEILEIQLANLPESIDNKIFLELEKSAKAIFEAQKKSTK